MAAKLALFPLQIVVFPNEDLNLHIFEPRYRQLVQDSEEHGITFGVSSYIEEQVMPIGTEVRLEEVVRKYPTGESDIRTKAIGMYQLKEFFPRLDDRLYAGGTVDRIAFDEEEDPEVNGQILYLSRQLFGLLNVDRELPDSPHDFSTYSIAHHIGFSLEQEYQFLCTLNAPSRQALMVEHLERIIPMVRETEEIRTKAKMNGHFKNLIPPNI